MRRRLKDSLSSDSVTPQFTLAHTDDNRLDSVNDWEPIIARLMIENQQQDGAHDIRHARAVYRNCLLVARALAPAIAPDTWVLMPAAYLHDVVNLPKDHPERSMAAEKSANLAGELLKQIGYPTCYHAEIVEAISSHSFSAGRPPQSISAKVLQDADRIDGLGVIGLGRALLVGGQLGSSLMAENDPFCANRSPDERGYVIDHLISRQLTIANQMNTAPGSTLASERTKPILYFLEQLEEESFFEQVVEFAS